MSQKDFGKRIVKKAETNHQNEPSFQWIKNKKTGQNLQFKTLKTAIHEIIHPGLCKDWGFYQDEI